MMVCNARLSLGRGNRVLVRGFGLAGPRLLLLRFCCCSRGGYCSVLHPFRRGQRALRNPTGPIVNASNNQKKKWNIVCRSSSERTPRYRMAYRLRADIESSTLQKLQEGPMMKAVSARKRLVLVSKIAVADDSFLTACLFCCWHPLLCCGETDLWT